MLRRCGWSDRVDPRCGRRRKHVREILEAGESSSEAIVADSIFEEPCGGDRTNLISEMLSTIVAMTLDQPRLGGAVHPNASWIDLETVRVLVRYLMLSIYIRGLLQADMTMSVASHHFGSHVYSIAASSVVR
jgi:hypothetical protein